MTVIYLSEKIICKNLKAFGFDTYDADTITHFNKFLEKFVENTLAKSIKKYTGGKIVLPMEYFGVETNHYVDDPSFQSTLPNQDFIRPPIELSGGATAKFTITLKAVESAIEEFTSKYHKEISNKTKVAKTLKNKFECVISTILSKIYKKYKKNHLCVNNLKSITDMKKHSILH
jgi:hypothetical protein